jgi:hypothetical protein
VANKRLYTESDVASLARGTTLVLGKDALATPAALDLAHARGVHVSWSDDKSTEVKPRDETFAKMLAQDGTYVVTVQRGNAIVTRLIDGVPTPFGSVS